MNRWAIFGLAWPPTHPAANGRAMRDPGRCLGLAWGVPLGLQNWGVRGEFRVPDSAVSVFSLFTKNPVPRSSACGRQARTPTPRCSAGNVAPHSLTPSLLLHSCFILLNSSALRVFRAIRGSKRGAPRLRVRQAGGEARFSHPWFRAVGGSTRERQRWLRVRQAGWKPTPPCFCGAYVGWVLALLAGICSKMQCPGIPEPRFAASASP